MRKFFLCVTLIAAFAAAGPAAQDRQRTPDIFRGRVDLITIDVAAVDSKGRPVENLRPGDFQVKVDGKVRPIVSADLIKVDRATPAPTTRPADALISTNASPQNARRIIVAVDQTLITPGMITPLLRTASQFVDRLVPTDYAAFIGFPEPGPRVDFTTDKPAVRRAMQGLNIGQPAKASPNVFDISLFEALTITGAESNQDKSILLSTPPGQPGPVMASVLARIEDAGLSDLCPPPPIGCPGGVYNDSVTITAEARQEGTISLHALEAILKDLVPLEGPKSMVVISAGMVNEDPSLLEGVKRLAAAARTTINVIAVDRDREQLTRQTSPRSDALIDRSFELQGLETIADITNGTLFRGVAAGAGIFERLEAELSARYLVAVERQPGDPESQRIEVDVKRRGVSVTSNKMVITGTVNTRRPAAELLSDALSSPFAISGIPLRVSTFTQRDTTPGQYRLRVAAQIGQPGEPAGEFALGYVLADDRGRPLAKAGSLRTLSPAASGPNQTLQYDTALSVGPGTYSLRFGVVDAKGRRGTVVHRIELPALTTDEIATSDLIVGNLPAEGETLRPSVEALITSSEMAGYLELYLPDTVRDGVSVRLEIAEGISSPALASETLTLRPAENPSWRVATGFVSATITPGRYLARATIRRDKEVIATLSRPIAIVRDSNVVSTPRPRVRAATMSLDLRQRTAAYVAGVVGGLGNIVAQEEFTLSRPDRRVTSDLLLVQYPGSQRDLIPYRDVAQVDGKPVPGREQRLVDLFLKPTDNLRERARQIRKDGEAFVPSAFDPMFVMWFLQSDFQARFDLTVSDAGSEWAREVKVVTFVETGRPTLLRTGTFGDIDVPTRGRAWIEEGTGRILQTELELGRGRSAPTMVTRFKLDDRYQVTVPDVMRTQNPDGLAIYTNFRQFGVATDAAIPPPPDQR